LINFSLCDIVGRSVLHFPVFFRNSHWVLFSANLSISSLTVHDPTGLLSNSAYQKEFTTFSEFVYHNCVHHPQISIVDAAPNYSRSYKVIDSGPLICGYMKHILSKHRNNIINVQSIRLHARKIILNTKIHKPKKQHIKTSTMLRAARVALAEKILINYASSDMEIFYKNVLDNCYLIRKVKPRTPYLGKPEKRGKMNGSKLKSLFYSNPKAAMKHILPSARADSYPSPKVFTEFITNNCSNQINLCNINYNANYYKRGSRFEFPIPTPEEIVACLQSKSQSAPESSGITYKDLLFCDPTGILLHHLFKMILERFETPQSWKNYNTLMIPKSGKDGEYHLPSSWRGIALQECIFKILTTLLCNQLIGWINQNELLHPLQKSLGPSDGCADHIFLIRAIIDYYRKW